MEQPLPHDPPPAIVNLIGAWADAWNAHDMERARTLIADNVDFVTVAGLWLKGADEFLAHHREIHRTHMRDTRWINRAYELAWIRPDLCLVHLEWTVAGGRGSDGAVRPHRDGLFTWLVENGGATGRILAAHNTNLRADARHRLSKPVPAARSN